MIKMNDSKKTQLITVVKNYDAIWNRRNKYHHNRYYLEKCWKNVAAKIQVDDVLIRKTWKSLRQEFRKQQTKLASAPEDAPAWPFYDSLTYLKDQFTTRSTDTSKNDCSNETHDQSSFLDIESLNKDSFLDFCKNSELIIKSEEMEDATTEDTSRNQPSSSFNDDSNDRSGSVVEETRNRKSMSDLFDVADEDVGFFTSLMPHVRSLSTQKKLLFRLKVQQCLYDLIFDSNVVNV